MAQTEPTAAPKLSVADRLKMIEAMGHPIAYDGCHKLYVLETQADIDEAEGSGYDVHPASRLNELYAGSCGLEFVSPWSLRDGYPWRISQFEDDGSVAWTRGGGCAARAH